MNLKHTLITGTVMLALAMAGCSSDGKRFGDRATVGGATPGATPGNVIDGTAGDDVLDGTSADETINGLDGDDIITGGDGADAIDGGNGNDTASYTNSTAAVQIDLLAGTAVGGDADGDTLTNIENLSGTSGDDVLVGDDNDNVLDGAGGNDTLTGNDGDDTISGGDSGDDIIDGGFGNDIIEGGPGADTLDGGGEDDTVSYAASTGAVTVDLNAQTATGGDATGDTIANFENARGGIDNDTLTGADGVNAVLEGGPGADIIDGGPNSANTASYEHAGAAVVVDLNTGVQGGTSDEQGDTLINIQNVRGSAFDDTLTTANAVLGSVEGGPGADTLIVSAQIGGVISYESSTDPVTVDLSANTASGGDAQGDDVSNIDIDGIVGSAGNDVLTGSEIFGTLLIGGDGDDTLTAGTGVLQFQNRLVGGEGNDTLTGGDLSVNSLMDGGGGADTVVGGNESDVIIYDPNDVSYDFLGMPANGVNLLYCEQNLDLANPGPTIANLHDISVPQVGGPQITVTLTPAQVVAVTDANNEVMIDANPFNANSDAAIVGTGWTQNGTELRFGVNYIRYDGAGGAKLLINPLVTNIAGVVP